MTCHSCRIECKRNGRDRKGAQRFQCRQCFKTFLGPQTKPLDGMYIPIEKAEMVLSLLLEGNSVSSVERVTGVHHGTILKLLVLVGEKCERIMATKIAQQAWSKRCGAVTLPQRALMCLHKNLCPLRTRSARYRVSSVPHTWRG